MLRLSPLIAAILALQAPSTTPRGWIEMKTKDGRYQFAMPAKPKERTTTQVTKYAGESLASDYLCVSNNCEYALQKMQTNVRVAADRKEEALDDLIKRALGMKLLSKKAIDFEGHPGRECLMEGPTSPRGPSTKMVWRLYLIGDDLIQMSVQAQKPEAEPKDAEAYFKSLHITSSEPKRK